MKIFRRKTQKKNKRTMDPYSERLSHLFLEVSTSKEIWPVVKSVAALCYPVESLWAIKAYLLHHSIVQDSNPHLNPLAFVFFQVTWTPPTLQTL